MIYLYVLLLSIWHSFLFRGYDYGVSVILYMIPLLILIIFYCKKNNLIVNKKSLFLSIPIVLLSLTYFIFDNNTFYLLNRVLIPILIVIMVITLIHDDKINTIRYYFFKVIFKPIKVSIEAIKEIIEKIENKLSMSDKQKEVLHQVIGGIVIIIPIVLLVIGLLSSADLEFRSIFSGLFDLIEKIMDKVIDFDFVSRLIGILITFFYMCGYLLYLRKYFKDEEKQVDWIDFDKKKKNLVNIFSIKTILCILNIIYLVFSIIQVKSLLMHDVGVNITYAEYARSGFFQLMVVSIINVLVILVSNKGIYKENDEKYINVMSTLMVIFTFIVLISAFIRMNYYESAYGYTELRLFVYIILFSEASLLIPTIMYIYDSKIPIIKIYTISILCIYVLVNYINIDYIISSRNLNRYYETSKIDLYYMMNLGSGSVSKVYELYKTTSDEALKDNIRDYYLYKEYELGFQDFNISKYLADKKIKRMR